MLLKEKTIYSALYFIYIYICILPNSSSDSMLFMSAAPIFTCSISSVLSSTWHLSSFPFLWLSVNQSNIKFADLSSEITTVLVLSPLT